MLRGVNLAGRQMIKMPALKTLCTSLGLRDVQTYIQSGNIIFREDKEAPSALARRLEAKIEAEFGFRPAVIMRTASELRKVIAKNPFAGQAGIEPNRLLVVFMDIAHEAGPGEGAGNTLRAGGTAYQRTRTLHLLSQRNGPPQDPGGPPGEGAAMLIHRQKPEYGQ